MPDPPHTTCCSASHPTRSGSSARLSCDQEKLAHFRYSAAWLAHPQALRFRRCCRWRGALATHRSLSRGSRGRPVGGHSRRCSRCLGPIIERGTGAQTEADFLLAVDDRTRTARCGLPTTKAYCCPQTSNQSSIHKICDGCTFSVRERRSAVSAQYLWHRAIRRPPVQLLEKRLYRLDTGAVTFI